MAAAERRRHFSAERLGAPALAVIHAGFEAGDPYEAICARVEADTGEHIARGSLARYWRFWRAEQKGREARVAAQKLVRDYTANPEEMGKLIEGLLTSELYASFAEAETKDIYLPDLLKGGAALVKAQISRRALAIEEQKLDLARRRFEGALAAVADKARAAGKTLDPDVMRMIREEIYGLGPDSGGEPVPAGAATPA